MKHGRDRRERAATKTRWDVYIIRTRQTAATSLVMRELSISPQKTDSPQARG